MKITVKNIHLGEMTSNTTRYDSDGNIAFKSENSFGGFDAEVEFEMTAEEFSQKMATAVQIMKELGPLTESITKAIIKVKNN